MESGNKPIQVKVTNVDDAEDEFKIQALKYGDTVNKLKNKIANKCGLEGPEQIKILLNEEEIDGSIKFNNEKFKGKFKKEEETWKK